MARVKPAADDNQGGNYDDKRAADDGNVSPVVDPAVTRSTAKIGLWTTIKWLLVYFTLYLAGIAAFLIIIAEPFTMSTYFSDNSLLPGLVNREFSLSTEAEYYMRILDKLTSVSTSDKEGPHLQNSLATLPAVTNFIKNELDNFGLEVYEQNFNYMSDNRQFNGTNMYSIIRGERSTSSESITLCAPFRKGLNSNTMASVSLTMAIAKYFSSRSYWAKDVIILFIDRDEHGLSAWLDSYYDVRLRQDIKRFDHSKDGLYYDSLTERGGPMQAAIVLELTGGQFTRVNLKIQGMYGQLPNLDLFNLVVELSARESVTPYFHNKSMPFGISDKLELYKHHLETVASFMRTQATMQSDGLHGLFLRYAIQSLTIEGPEHKKSERHVIAVSLLNIGRLIEGVFRSLNNLTERFNRSYYFYILLSMRRFTSIGYYSIAFGLLVAPLILKAYNIHQHKARMNLFIGLRGIILLTTALILSVLSTFNISTALIVSVAIVPILLII